MLVDPRFSAVADKFFALTKAQPHGGASLAVYKNGAPVLDIWAGESRPGGSVRDEEVIAAAKAANVPMFMTGVRHFSHA